MPHARVARIDTSAALAMPGVKAILTADDLPTPCGANLGEGIAPDASERALTNEAALSPASRFSPWRRWTSSPRPRRSSRSRSTSSRCRSWSIRSTACGPAARTRDRGQRVGSRRAAAPGAPEAAAPASGRERLKWTAADFADAARGQLPMGKATEEWSFGDLRGRLQVRRPRPRRDVRRARRPGITRWKRAARWPTGRTASCTCTARRRAWCAPLTRVARWVGIEPNERRADLRIHRRRIRQQGRRRRVDGHSGAAVEEGQRAGDDAHQPRGGTLHRPRPHQMHGRVKVGFAKDGRITALDLFIVQDSGPYGPMGDSRRPATTSRSSISRRRCGGAPSTC